MKGPLARGPFMLPQTAQSVAYFYSATLAWNLSAIDRHDSIPPIRLAA